MKTVNKNILLLAFALGIQACGGNSPAGPELGEELSGGHTTVFANSLNSFNQFAANLTFQQQADFQIGNSFFEQDWVTAPATTTARDGLGPLFNANSCASCHAKDGRGAPPKSVDEEPLALLFRLSVPGENEFGAPLPEPRYGDQLQNHSILGVEPEASVRVSYTEIPGVYPDGEKYTLHRPTYDFVKAAYGDFSPDMLVSPRIAPVMIGVGLLEAVPEEDILALADPEDSNGDGISGRPNYVWDAAQGKKALGRFGWKANQPDVRQQVAGAFLGDVGITSSLFPDESCSPVQEDCLLATTGGSPELQDEIFDKVVFYTQTLAVPARRDWQDAFVLQGKQIFQDLQCASCHRPKLQTGDHPIPQLAHQTIRPFTDLLLHDMGPDLADGRPDFEAGGSEWRTPPLWGIGLVFKVNGHTRFLHDGRAANLEEAILWHGGEAQNSRDQFTSLKKQDREALIRFLESL